ncbi:MAG: aldehyde dehydrogenase family protein [Porticoccaceae bacterium]
MRAVDDICAGYVWVNNSSDHFLGTPYGGMKQSGIGREEDAWARCCLTPSKRTSISLSRPDAVPVGPLTVGIQ